MTEVALFPVRQMAQSLSLRKSGSPLNVAESAHLYHTFHLCEKDHKIDSALRNNCAQWFCSDSLPKVIKTFRQAGIVYI